MGELKIIYIILAIVVLAAQFLLYARPNTFGIFIINLILALVICFISFTARASNDTTERMIVLALGALSLVAIVPRYTNKKNITLSNILLSISLIGGLIYSLL